MSSLTLSVDLSFGLGIAHNVSQNQSIRNFITVVHRGVQMKHVLTITVLTASTFATSADAALTLGGLSLSGPNFSLSMSGTINTPYNIECTQIRVTSDQAGPWGTDSWFMSNLASMTIGDAVVNRIDVQTWATGSQLVIFFSNSFVTGEAVSGSVQCTMPGSGSFNDLANRTFRIAATPSSGWSGGQYLFTGLTSNEVPAPGALALLGLAGLTRRSRR
jgi:MYXO-CTERM domain-containing protein